MSLQSYSCEVRWTHRKRGPDRWSTRQRATGIHRAGAKALRAFLTEHQHSPTPEIRTATLKARRDAHTHLTLELWRIPRGRR